MEFLFSHCSDLLQWHGSVYLTLFIAGLTGGFTHCIMMCGAFSSCGNSCASNCASKKIINDSAVQYHLGRATTYGALGFACAFLSKQVATLPLWPKISAAMLFMAGIMFLVSVIPQCKHAVINFAGKLPYLKGLLLGFLPCGMLYAALMLAATTANPVSGMIAMWCFVLGTLPALTLTRIGIKILNDKYKNIMQKIIKVTMTANGCLLLIMAAKIMR